MGPVCRCHPYGGALPSGRPWSGSVGSVVHAGSSASNVYRFLGRDGGPGGGSAGKGVEGGEGGNDGGFWRLPSRNALTRNPRGVPCTRGKAPIGCGQDGRGSPSAVQQQESTRRLAGVPRCACSYILVVKRRRLGFRSQCMRLARWRRHGLIPLHVARRAAMARVRILLHAGNRQGCRSRCMQLAERDGMRSDSAAPTSQSRPCKHTLRAR